MAKAPTVALPVQQRRDQKEMRERCLLCRCVAPDMLPATLPLLVMFTATHLRVQALTLAFSRVQTTGTCRAAGTRAKSCSTRAWRWRWNRSGHKRRADRQQQEAQRCGTE